MAFYRWPIFGCALGFALILNAPAYAEEPIRFQLRVTPAGSGAHLSPIPSVEAVLRFEGLLPMDAAAQLTEVVEEDLAGRADGMLYAPVYEGGEWRLSAKVEPRGDLHLERVQSFAATLGQCYRSLPDGENAGALHFIFMGFQPSGEGMLANAQAAGQTMAEHYAADRCATVGNQDDVPKERLEGLARGMLTDQFDAALFPGSLPSTLVPLLEPLFFGKSGIWVSEQGAALKAIIVESTKKGLLAENDFSKLQGEPSQTFWDWVKATVRTQPSVVTSFVQGIADGCVGSSSSIRDLGNSFSLKTCIESGRIQPLHVQVGTNGYVLVTGMKGVSR